MIDKFFYSIELGGTQMTNDKFEFLVNNIMVGGTKHLYSKKEIEYGCNLYSNAIEDMHMLANWCKKYNMKPIYKEQKITTKNNEITAELVRYEIST